VDAGHVDGTFFQLGRFLQILKSMRKNPVDAIHASIELFSNRVDSVALAENLMERSNILVNVGLFEVDSGDFEAVASLVSSNQAPNDATYAHVADHDVQGDSETASRSLGHHGGGSE
jgi:hypothetical protein